MKNLKHFLTQLLPFTGSVLVQGRTLQREKESGQSSVILIIIILVIVMAVMFAGGGASLFSGNTASPITGTPIPTSGNGTTTPGLSPSTSPNSDPNWSIGVQMDSKCQTNAKTPYLGGKGTVKGNTSWYVSFDIEKSSNNWTQDFTQSYTNPQNPFTMTLHNDSGYNTKNWRIQVFSEGVRTNGGWTGGTLKTEYDGSPTGC